MDIAALAAELASGHPDTGAYDADDSIAAGQLNAMNRTRNKTSMTGSEVINAIVPAAWNALTAVDQQKVWNIAHLGTVNPFNIEATMLMDIFGAGSDTITALKAARVNNVSRAEELGFGLVKTGHIEQARA